MLKVVVTKKRLAIARATERIIGPLESLNVWPLAYSITVHVRNIMLCYVTM